MEKKLICPKMSRFIEGEFREVYCYEADCAHWDTSYDHCADVTNVMQIERIANHLENN